MTEKRLQKRRKMVLPVKIALPGSSLLVHTLDISVTGVRLGAIRKELLPGQMVSLSRGAKKAQYRIIWVEQRDHEFHAGLEAVQVNENFWGVDLDAEHRESKENAFLKVLKAGSGH